MYEWLRNLSFETLFSRTVFGFIFLLPLFVIPALSFLQIGQAKVLYAATVVGVLFFAYAVYALYTKTIRVPRDTILAAALLIPIAYTVSAIMSGWGLSSLVGSGIEQDTVAAALLWYAALIVSVLAMYMGRTLPFKLLLAAYVGSVFALTFFVLKLVFPGAPFSFGGVLAGASGNLIGSWHDANIAAALVFLLSPVLPFFAPITSRALSAVAILGFLVSAIVIGIGGFVDVLLAVCVLGFASAAALFLYGREKKGALIVAGILVCASVLSGILLFAHSRVAEMLPAALAVNELEVRPSWQGTFAVGQRVFSGEGSLVFGTGPNTFAQEWGRYKPADINSTLFWGVDFNAGIGAVPTALVTTGIFGLLAWASVLFLFAYFLWGFCMRQGMRTGESRALILLGASTLILLVFHVVYVPGPALSILTFLLLGACIAARAHETYATPLVIRFDFGTYSDLLRSIGLVLGVIIVGLALAFTFRAVLSHAYVNKAVATYTETNSLPDTQAALTKALLIWNDNDRAHRAAVELGLLTLQSLAASGNLDEAGRARLQTELAGVVTHGLTAVSINEENYQNWLVLAQMYQELAGVGVEGAYEAAKQAFERTLTENPTNPLPLLRLAQLERLAGNTDASLEYLNQAIAIRPGFAEAHFLRSIILAGGGDFAEAVLSAEAAVRLAPQDPLAWYNLGAVLYAEGSYEKAAPALQQAIVLRADYADALFMLSLSFERMGRTEESLLLLRRVRELNPDNAELNAKIESLEAGE